MFNILTTDKNFGITNSKEDLYISSYKFIRINTYYRHIVFIILENIISRNNNY